jgi:valyl-tRNA synthetase
MSIDESFPKRYEPKIVEKKTQDFWNQHRQELYAYQPKSGTPVFSIDTPPPTVSGKLHIGHVFSYTHTEIVSRYKRMKGFQVFYPFGYDDNGLPTEILTEKDYDVKAYKMERGEFQKLCRETGKKYAELFKNLWLGLGFTCDFDQAYSTISDSSQRISQWSFVDLFQKGKVERRNEPALWCVQCCTSFAQAEIDDVPQDSRFIHIPFAVEGSSESITIATTRPELLPACVAVFVHPEDQRFTHLHNKKVKVPLFGHTVTILPDEMAQKDKGTGAVMCCTFGDSTDIAWWRKHQLPLREAISKTGTMTEMAGEFAGLKIKEARSKLVKKLEELQLATKIVPIAAKDRVVNTHERCGTPVEFLVQPQWFVKVTEAKDELIAMGQKIRWTPEHMRYRYENWVQNLSWDWAISRQRSFGVPIPAWYSSEGNHIYCAKAEDLPLDPLKTQPPIPCPAGQWVGESDVMDTWATSSVTPLINARYGSKEERAELIPMSMRPQAHDIIRTWAFYTIAKSFFHRGDIPWKDIVISGHVQKPGVQVEASQLAGQDFARKTKISKSKDGDTFNPEKILERHSADAIRLWTAGVSMGSDTLFDDAAISEGTRFLNKLWNASRFALLSLGDFKPCKAPTVNAEDFWIRGLFNEVLQTYHRSFEAYELHRARVELDKFFWMSFCDNYIEFVKCRLAAASEAERLSSCQTVYDILLGLLKIYAPFAPHITEEIYQNYFKAFETEKSLHLLKLPEAQDVSADMKSGLTTGNYLVAVISAIRSFKSQNQIGFKVPAESLKVQSSDEGVQHLEKVKVILQNFASATQCSVSTQELGSDAVATEQPNTKISLQIAPEHLKPKAS